MKESWKIGRKTQNCLFKRVIEMERRHNLWHSKDFSHRQKSKKIYLNFDANIIFNVLIKFRDEENDLYKNFCQFIAKCFKSVSDP